MRVLAVDFGTSNTVAAFVDRPGGPVRLLSVDGWPTLPSAVWLAPQGHLVVGREAQRQARLDPSRYEPNPKSRIDDGEVLLGEAVLPVPELIAAVLRRVAGEARRQLGGDPDLVVLTHPADWHQLRRTTLQSAARAAGWRGPVELLAEPVAAATHFATMSDQLRIQPGQAIAVFDMGGGTTDAAVLVRTATGWQTLASAGLPDLGGTDLDHALLTRIRATVQPEHPQWTELLQPRNPAARRASRALSDDVQAGKESLSLYPATDIPLPDPLPDAHITRDELEELVGQQLQRAAAMLAAAVADARVPPGRLVAIYLVGGSTRMPLVAKLISRQVRVLPTAIESPETTVATGAVAAMAAPVPVPQPVPGPPTPVPTPTMPAPPPTPPGAMPVPTPPGALPAQAPIAYREEPRRKHAAWWIAAVVGILVAGLVATLLVLNREKPPAQAGSEKKTEQRADDKSDTNTTTSEDPEVEADGGSAGAEVDPDLVLGPTGFRDLELSMTLEQAMNTGQLAPRSDVPAPCENVDMVDDQGTSTGFAWFDGEAGFLVGITPSQQSFTPEGVTAGSARDAVGQAYPDAQEELGAQDIWLIAPVPSNAGAEYHFRLNPDDNTVLDMTMTTTENPCL